MPSEVWRACPTCEERGYHLFLEKGHLSLVQCNGCGMIYTNPIDAALVSGEFYDQLANPFYLSPDKLQSDYAPVRFERELRLFRRFCKKGRVLDVGCSTGAFLYQLQHRFGNDYEVQGIDVVGPALDYAEQQGVPVLRESFLKIEFPEKTFSAVTFWAVMEHLANPHQFLSKAASILAPGGFCFILVPNFTSLAVRVLGKKYRYIFPQHVNYFTPSTLKRFTSREFGFEIVYRGSTHFNPLVIYQDWKGKGEFVSDENRARLLKKTTGYKQNPLFRPAKVALKGTEAVLNWFKLADNIVIVLQKTVT
jgi:2-polyprenyl-3-methyl-5-hydroxy-6-metoxy-1,4-benzoquinol methylase